MTTNAATSPDASASVSRIAVLNGAEPGDWQKIYNRIDAGPHRLVAALTNVSAALATFAGLFGVMGLIALVVWNAYPAISSYYLAVLVIPPGFLVGAAAGQAGGNLFLRVWYRLDDATRRGFATRLTLGRAPASWSGAVRRWLFTGDWLGTPSCDMRLPYVRIFVLGDAPATCREEDGIWHEIHGAISGDSLWEAGSNHREISYPSVLPGWARQVGKGDGMEELRKQIGGRVANDWVAHLWRRACRQWPALGGSFPDNARRDSFEIHSLLLSRGREALVVILRPSAHSSAIPSEPRATAAA